jgi:beta-mannosidase
MAYIGEQLKHRKIMTTKCIGHEPPGRSFVRKEQCNFGWDWGPVLVTAGIWKDIGLTGFSAARLLDTRIIQAHSKNSVDLKIETNVQIVSGKGFSAEVSVVRKGKVLSKNRSAVSSGKARNVLTVKNPELWWPNDMGGQPLYEIRVRLLDASGRALDCDSKKIGLRTLELVRKKDRWGQSFHFSVNGTSFFAKGANWIPADAFSTEVTPERLRILLQAAKDGHMNFLRVWGGGIYESDAYYDLCDEMGIFIWHDFMFACAAYPTDIPGFMDSVRHEAEDQIRRLRHHPSIALWCGNNELEGWIVKFNTDVTSWPLMPPRYYSRLFDEMLPAICKRLDPLTPYWPSSPHTPVGDRDDSSNVRSGDAHLWGVWHGAKPFEWYRECFHRFVSEFGFQSFPEPKTIASFARGEETNMTHPIMEFHQRGNRGNPNIMHSMLSWFRMPKGNDAMVWMSQIQHGLAVKFAVEHWRRIMPRCMGALYWQINDTWPAVSWASIDYFGRWKALHYMAKQFFAPLLISGLELPEKKKIEVHVSSDMLKDVSATASVKVTDMTGKTLESFSRKLSVPERKSFKAFDIDLQDHWEHKGRNLLIWLELRVAGRIVSDNMVTFYRPKTMEVVDPGLSFKIRRSGKKTYSVACSSRRPALWAFLGLKTLEGRFSENFFCLPGRKTVKVELRFEKPVSPARVRKDLIYRSLFDLYE